MYFFVIIWNIPSIQKNERDLLSSVLGMKGVLMCIFSFSLKKNVVLWIAYRKWESLYLRQAVKWQCVIHSQHISNREISFLSLPSSHVFL